MGSRAVAWFRNCALWSQALQSICGSTSGKKDAEDSYEGVLCAGGRLATYASLASILQAASKALESTKTKPVLTHKCMN